jgi:hypothetical protein
VTETKQFLETAFDTNTEEGSPDFEPLPKGNYVVSVRDINAGPLKSGRGQAVNATLEVEGGKYAGRLLWDRIIIAHESGDAMKFGRRRFKDLADACGITEQITDLAVLCHKPVLVFVKIEQDEAGEYPPKNRVTRYKKIAEAKKPNGDDGKPFDDKIDF